MTGLDQLTVRRLLKHSCPWLRHPLPTPVDELRRWWGSYGRWSR